MESASPFQFFDDNDDLDPTFLKREHNDLLEAKEISEFGRVWAKPDTKKLNLHLHSEWRNLDARPTKEAMWSTRIFVPRLLSWSSARVDSSFRLDQKLTGSFSQTITIQKRSCHAVCCFRLDIMPHAVSGPKAFKKCTMATLVQQGVVLEHDRNHFFQEKGNMALWLVRSENRTAAAALRLVADWRVHHAVEGASRLPPHPPSVVNTML